MQADRFVVIVERHGEILARRDRERVLVRVKWRCRRWRVCGQLVEVVVHGAAGGSLHGTKKKKKKEEEEEKEKEEEEKQKKKMKKKKEMKEERNE